MSKTVVIIDSEDLSSQIVKINSKKINEKILRKELELSDERECEIESNKGKTVYSFFIEDGYHSDAIFVVTDS